MIVRFALACGLSLLAAAIDHEIGFLVRLREMGLLRLAEQHSEELLSRSDREIADRVLLTIELSKICVARALNSRPPERDQFWSQATAVIQAERRRYPPQTPDVQPTLLDAQAALTTVQQAEWACREAEVRATTDAPWDVARTLLRRAISELKGVEESLEGLRLRGDDPELSAAHLEELLRNVELQLAITYRNQAITYAQQPLDRANSLTQALAVIEPLASSTVVDDLVWQSRLERIRCRRLLGDVVQTRDLINACGDLPERYLGALAAEGVRLALDTGQSQLAARLTESSEVDSHDPHFQLARIETLVTLSKDQAPPNQVSDEVKQGWREQAMRAVNELRERNGTYWGLRGEMLLTRWTEGDTKDSDAALIQATAETLLRRGLPEQAVAMFERGARDAEQAGKPDEAFLNLFRAATVEQQEGNLQAAIDRYRQIALAMPQHPRAPEGHALAIFDAATLYQQAHADTPRSAPLLTQYRELLTEHIQHWSHATTADQVRLWGGRLAAAEGRTFEAAQLFMAVGPNSPHAPECHQRLAALYHAQSVIRDGTRRDQQLTAAGPMLAARRWFDDRAEQTQDVTQSVFLLTESARLHLGFAPREYGVAVQRLKQALPKAQGNAKTTARTLLVAALCGLGQVTLAEAELVSTKGISPVQLIDLLRELAVVRDARPNDSELQRMIAELLQHQPTVPKWNQNQQLVWDEALADSSDARQAVTIYARLATEQPRDLRVQRRYAEVLTGLGGDEFNQVALSQWRLLSRISPTRSSDWFRCKLGIAQIHTNMGDRQKARDVIELTRGLHPDLGGPDIEKEFLQLLSQVNID